MNTQTSSPVKMINDTATMNATKQIIKRNGVMSEHATQGRPILNLDCMICMASPNPGDDIDLRSREYR